MNQRKSVLTGTHVSLAEMVEADQTKFCVWLQNPALRSLIDDSRVPDLKEQMKWFLRVQQPDRKFFSIVTVLHGELIGNCGFVDIDPVRQEATLRITIGNPDFIGKGYGSEAVKLLVRYGCESMSLKRILLKVLESNTRAIRAYEKAGFTLHSREQSNEQPILTMQTTLPDRI